MLNPPNKPNYIKRWWRGLSYSFNLYFNFSFQHSCCPTSNCDFYRNVRSGKVMFSLVSVCPQTGGYAWSHVPSGGVPAWSQVPSRWWVCPGGWVYWRKVYQGVRYTRGSGIPEGVYQRGVYQRGWVCCGGMYTHPTPGTNHHNTYGWQACGTHPTGMLSCCE